MEIYRNINRERYQFDFVKHTENECDFDQEIKELGGRIFIIPRFHGTNFIEYKKAWEKLFTKNKDIQVIHANMLTTAFIYFPIAKKNGLTKIIAHSRSASEDRFDKIILAKLSRFYATDLIAVSKKASISAFGKRLTNSEVLIINDVIDVKKYGFSQYNRAEIRNEFKISDRKVFGHVGRFHISKNHSFLLKVFQNFLRVEPKAILMLVGDGPLKSKIKNQIKKLNIEKNVILCGLRTDVEKFYSAFDLLLFPSIYEGYPGVIIEAQASGLKVIMSNFVTSEVVVSNLVSIANIKSIKQWTILASKLKLNYRRNDFKLSSSVKNLNEGVKLFESYYANKTIT